MSAGAAPLPPVGAVGETGADRVEFDIAGSGEKVVAVEGKRREPALPQEATPAFAEVDMSGIAAISLNACEPCY